MGFNPIPLNDLSISFLLVSDLAILSFYSTYLIERTSVESICLMVFFVQRICVDLSLYLYILLCALPIAN